MVLTSNLTPTLPQERETRFGAFWSGLRSWCWCSVLPELRFQV